MKKAEKKETVERVFNEEMATLDAQRAEDQKGLQLGELKIDTKQKGKLVPLVTREERDEERQKKKDVHDALIKFFDKIFLMSPFFKAWEEVLSKQENLIMDEKKLDGEEMMKVVKVAKDAFWEENKGFFEKKFDKEKNKRWVEKEAKKRTCVPTARLDPRHAMRTCGPPAENCAWISYGGTLRAARRRN